MADRDGKGVGDVVRFWRVFEAEELGDHELDLALVGASVADDGQLHLGRRVFSPGKAFLAAGEEDYAEGLGDVERGGLVGGEELALGCDGVGLVVFDQIAELLVDAPETVGHGDPRGLDETLCDRLKARPFPADETVAESFEAGINAEDQHGRALEPEDQACMVSRT